MKLYELAASKAIKISQVFESYFGSKISFDQLNRRQTSYMLTRVRGILGEHQQTSARHTSEQNPEYLKLVMMEQALRSRLSEQGTFGAPANTPMAGAAAAPATSAATAAATAAQATKNIAAQKDPKVKMALTKASKGQSLNPDEQKTVSGIALMQAESRLRRAFTRLNESEVQQAQVVLAAQDMVDTMQGMLEDITSMQFKELPALVDSIKNQVGQDQAMQFNTDVNAALSGLVQNLQTAKQQLDAALGVVTGQAPAEIPGADTGLPMEPGADLGADTAELDDLAIDAADDLDNTPQEPKMGLGRARR
jgi:hypothetical protein